MTPAITYPDMTRAQAVIDALRAGTDANLCAACRQGSVDRIHAPGRLIATGDLHDNPIHFANIVAAAGLDGSSNTPPAHLTLHELIHSDRLINGMDFSYRVLAKAATLKARHPELVHTLLANHELAQIAGAGITKDGVNVVAAFNNAVDYIFGSDAPDVTAAINAFIRSMPLALFAHGHSANDPLLRRSLLLAHSLPSPELMDRFDPAVLERPLDENDYIPRRGSAHLMVWGRGHQPDQLAQLAQRWSAETFILGHEQAENGALLVADCALILNSDHESGRVLPLELDALAPAAILLSHCLPIENL